MSNPPTKLEYAKHTVRQLGAAARGVDIRTIGDTLVVSADGPTASQLERSGLRPIRQSIELIIETLFPAALFFLAEPWLSKGWLTLKVLASSMASLALLGKHLYLAIWFRRLATGQASLLISASTITFRLSAAVGDRSWVWPRESVKEIEAMALKGWWGSATHPALRLRRGRRWRDVNLPLGANEREVDQILRAVSQFMAKAERGCDRMG